MTKVISLSDNVAISFSDTEFKPYRKKPTIAIRSGNSSTKIATFNNQQTFELFLQFLNVIFTGKEETQ